MKVLGEVLRERKVKDLSVAEIGEMLFIKDWFMKFAKGTGVTERQIAELTHNIYKAEGSPLWEFIVEEIVEKEVREEERRLKKRREENRRAYKKQVRKQRQRS